MKNAQKAYWFLSGFLIAVLTVSFLPPALAALTGQTISVYTGVNVYVDDQLIQPKDANGNPVEPFTYNGTIYLPIRAVGEALGLPVQWESKTSSAYVGPHKKSLPAVSIWDLPKGKNAVEEWHVYDGKDNLGQIRQNAIDFQSDFYVSEVYYDINGRYSAISGTLFQKYEKRFAAGSPSTLWIYGDNKLLFQSNMEGGMDPVDFYIGLEGVQTLAVFFNSPEGYAAIADFGVWE